MSSEEAKQIESHLHENGERITAARMTRIAGRYSFEINTEKNNRQDQPQ